MVTTFTYKPSLVSIDARNFELLWWQNHKHTHTQTDTGDYNTLRRSLVRSVMTSYNSTVQCMVGTCQNETTSAWK